MALPQRKHDATQARLAGVALPEGAGWALAARERALERLGRTGMRSILRKEERQDTLNMVVRASFALSRSNTGALIVIERETGLQEVIDTGIPMNAMLSVELLLSIFPETGPLHDGAVVVRGGSIVSAGCTLPLSDSPLPAEYGMRHRAAVGLTERTDAVVVVVSEERDRDARVVQALIHGTDGGEEIDLRAAPRQPLRALDGDLGLAAIDMRVVADDDDAHGAAYLIAIT